MKRFKNKLLIALAIFLAISLSLFVFSIIYEGEMPKLVENINNSAIEAIFTAIITERITTKICPVEFFNRVAKCSKGAADLAVTAFVHLDNPAAVVAVVLAFECQAARSVRHLHAKVIDHLPVERLERLVERH